MVGPVAEERLGIVSRDKGPEGARTGVPWSASIDSRGWYLLRAALAVGGGGGGGRRGKMGKMGEGEQLLQQWGDGGMRDGGGWRKWRGEVREGGIISIQPARAAIRGVSNR